MHIHIQSYIYIYYKNDDDNNDNDNNELYINVLYIFRVHGAMVSGGFPPISPRGNPGD